jgi:hypothetical protein
MNGLRIDVERIHISKSYLARYIFRLLFAILALVAVTDAFRLRRDGTLVLKMKPEYYAAVSLSPNQRHVNLNTNEKEIR